LAAEAAASGSQRLHERLAVVDPVSAERLHPNDLRRLVRALEVWELTGRPLSDWQQQWRAVKRSQPDDVPRALWLDLPRSVLYARIDTRVQAMIDSGWLAEAAALRQLPKPLSREASQALGYQDLFAHLDGRANLPETIVRIQLRTRQFAKRQMTWFRNLPECRPTTRELTFAAWGLTM
jgi:tRNA dimethylallyltransferase